MQSGLKGIWQITEAGRAYVNSLGEKLKDRPEGGETCCTPDFFHRFFQIQVYSEDTADQLLLEQLFREEALEEPLTALSDKPVPKGPAVNRSGGRMVYLRDPSVARRALAYAGHRCEVDGTHPSFRRRNADHLYMEPHHLIPMAKTEHFGVSLDREQNIFPSAATAIIRSTMAPGRMCGVLSLCCSKKGSGKLVPYWGEISPWRRFIKFTMYCERHRGDSL